MRHILGLFCSGIVLVSVLGLLGIGVTSGAHAESLLEVRAIASSPALNIQSTQVQYLKELDLLVFEQQLNGVVGSTLPQSVGQLDGAPVLGYVFPTTLSPEDVGFSTTEGILALAATSHPDFDDTPLWDENNDRDYANDGVIWHTHWVVLSPDERVSGNLSVLEFDPNDNQVVLPPTNPGMPMYMDSPGFSVVAEGDTLRVLVPAQRVNNRTDFKVDGVTAYMEVNTSDVERPLLGVYRVYSIGSGDLSLPYAVQYR